MENQSCCTPMVRVKNFEPLQDILLGLLWSDLMKNCPLKSFPLVKFKLGPKTLPFEETFHFWASLSKRQKRIFVQTSIKAAFYTTENIRTIGSYDKSIRKYYWKRAKKMILCYKNATILTFFRKILLGGIQLRNFLYQDTRPRKCFQIASGMGEVLKQRH